MATLQLEQRESNSAFKNFRLQWALMSAYERLRARAIGRLGAQSHHRVGHHDGARAALRARCTTVDRWCTRPSGHNVFQSLFGSIFTVLIALEFKHSIVRQALRRDSIVQVRTFLLIALLALSRKFVILDSAATPAPTIAALGFATLVLGIVCRLLREPQYTP